MKLAVCLPSAPRQFDAEAFFTSPFDYYDKSFINAFVGIDTARPFFSNINAPVNTVGIYAGDACKGILGVTPSTSSTRVICNTTVTPVNTLLSLNALDVNPTTGATGSLVNPAVATGSVGTGVTAPVVDRNAVHFIVNAAVSQGVFGTPFGSVPRNALRDAKSNLANASIFKNIKLGERANFEMHLTMNNAFNHFNFVNVDPSVEDAGIGKFGQDFANPSVTAAAGRTIWIGGRLTF